MPSSDADVRAPGHPKQWQHATTPEKPVITVMSLDDVQIVGTEPPKAPIEGSILDPNNKTINLVVDDRPKPRKGKAKSKTFKPTDEINEIFWNRKTYRSTNNPALREEIRKRCMLGIIQFGPHSVTYLDAEDLMWFPVTCRASGQTALLGCPLNLCTPADCIAAFPEYKPCYPYHSELVLEKMKLEYYARTQCITVS